ncbi:outer membrane protein with beta-barrel domain [Cellulophaga sp. RHA19]|uniref:outer membrane beta-barrel protein n=1 Tax=Cellulophaga sp. RHA19 TaxID=1798237 RepID=UPI000C2B6838|nr:outer membrane beta-barrel protein [Cellulophaga sp. RHA19]PKB42548.1 outer membrane protein with beta-barrel domain [Cellulophaga sp. RHA19]
MSKENLDKLFQDKFKDFGDVPDEKVWQKLNMSLDQKKKDRLVIPIWWKLGGIAAALALLFFAIKPFFKNDNAVVPVITDTEKVLPNTNVEVVSKDANIIEKDASNDSKSDLNIEEEVVVGTTSTKKNKETSVVKNTSVAHKKNASFNAFAATQKSGYRVNREGNTSLEAKNGYSNNVADASIKNKNAKQENLEAGNVDNVEAKSLSVLKDKKEEFLSKQIEKAVVDIDTVGKKSIYDAIKENKEETVASAKTDKWSVGANVAPVYFNSLKDGSPVDPSFVSNSKSGNVNMSYGVTVAYEVSKKLSIRSGVHKVDYGYNTNNVFFKSAFDPASNSMVNTIDYNASAESIVIQTNRDVLSEPSNSKLEEVSYAAKSTSREGKMVQQFGYLEVPLELNYALIDGNFGVHLIGGVSSLFLVDDSISLESENLVTKIGESNNINSLNFSTNIGFGLNYKFTPNMQLSVEPMFKYQLNTFSNTSGDFQPFSMGVYSGLSFKF